MDIQAKARIDSAYGFVNGVLAANPLKEAGDMWGPSGSSTELMRWLDDPVTKHIRECMNTLAMNPPCGLVSVDTNVNFGLTTGLQLATQVMLDPTILFAHVFEQPGETALPTPDYITPA
jgi:hypothetical protein